jgi:hypothetical protein
MPRMKSFSAVEQEAFESPPRSCRLASFSREREILNLGGMEVADYIVIVEKVSCDAG